MLRVSRQEPPRCCSAEHRSCIERACGLQKPAPNRLSSYQIEQARCFSSGWVSGWQQGKFTFGSDRVMVLQPQISSYIHAFYHNKCTHRCSCCLYNRLIDIYLLKKKLFHDFNPTELRALLLYSGEEFPRFALSSARGTKGK